VRGYAESGCAKLKRCLLRQGFGGQGSVKAGTADRTDVTDLPGLGLTKSRHAGKGVTANCERL
jgi:hypothetical protein